MAGRLRFSFDSRALQLEKQLRRSDIPIADAAKNAVEDVADAVKVQSRASILAAGFPKRYANAFRVNVYPRGEKISINAAAYAYHKIDNSEIFETGGKITGKPILWLPLGPKKKGNAKRIRLKDVQEKGVELITVKRAGKPPLILGPKQRGLGFRKRAGQDLVPLFVGIELVTIPKKFGIYRIIAANAAKLSGLYFRYFRDY